MIDSKNHAELKADIKAKTDKRVSENNELFANLSEGKITEKKKERAQAFKEENKELLNTYKNQSQNVDTLHENLKKELLAAFDEIMKEYSFIAYKNDLRSSSLGIDFSTKYGYSYYQDGKIFPDCLRLRLLELYESHHLSVDAVEKFDTLMIQYIETVGKQNVPWYEIKEAFYRHKKEYAKEKLELHKQKEEEAKAMLAVETDEDKRKNIEKDIAFRKDRQSYAKSIIDFDWEK